jgi:GINS complex subunit 2
MPWPPSSASATSTSAAKRDGEIVSPPFIAHSTTATADAGAGKAGHLPYHWLELGELLLGQCPDSFGEAGANYTRSLLRDIREVRQSKLRAGMKGLEGGGVVSLRGVGAMEIATEKAFVVGMIGGLRKVGASREAARREREEEEGVQGGGEDDEDEMDL